LRKCDTFSFQEYPDYILSFSCGERHEIFENPGQELCFAFSVLIKGQQKLKYSKHFHVYDIVVKVGPVSKINRKAEAKGSFVFRCSAKLILADKRGGKERNFRERTLCSDDAT